MEIRKATVFAKSVVPGKTNGPIPTKLLPNKIIVIVTNSNKVCLEKLHGKVLHHEYRK